jgi:hypothetical protein
MNAYPGKTRGGESGPVIARTLHLQGVQLAALSLHVGSNLSSIDPSQTPHFQVYIE